MTNNLEMRRSIAYEVAIRAAEELKTGDLALAMLNGEFNKEQTIAFNDAVIELLMLTVRMKKQAAANGSVPDQTAVLQQTQEIVEHYIV